MIVYVTGGTGFLGRQIVKHVECWGHIVLAPRSSECDLLSLSPKTANSDPQGAWRERHRQRRGRLDVLRGLVRRFPEHQLKFVVTDGDDLPEILGLIDAVGGVEAARVLLMAEGRSAAEVAEKGPEVAALCSEHGFRYTPRLHLDLFGGGRGV